MKKGLITVKEFANLWLTHREIEMLRMLTKDWSAPQIGKRLGLTKGTTRVYLHDLYRKINVSGRAGAAVWAVRNGIAK